MTGLDYVRRAYGVPAKCGGLIRYTDERGAVLCVRILSASNGRLIVQSSGPGKRRLILHPTWRVEYV